MTDTNNTDGAALFAGDAQTMPVLRRYRDELAKVLCDADPDASGAPYEERVYWPMASAALDWFARHRIATQEDAERSGVRVALADWRKEIRHPNNRLLFKRMVDVAGIDLGSDDIATGLQKIAMLAARKDRP